MSADSTRDLGIFTEALGLPAEERRAHLDRARAGDANPRRKVELFLAHDDRSGLNRTTTKR